MWTAMQWSETQALKPGPFYSAHGAAQAALFQNGHAQQYGLPLSGALELSAGPFLATRGRKTKN